MAAGGYREDEDMSDLAAQDDSDIEHDYNPEPIERQPSEQDVPIVPKHEEVEPSLADTTLQAQEPTEDPASVDDYPSAMDVELVDDEEEPKPKPILKLSYHGFTIHGRCLCVIVEPWPPLRAATRAPSLTPMGIVAPRAPSIAPPDFVPSGGNAAAAQRERTPLFLPDFDREPTPAPSGARVRPPVPLFSDAIAMEGSDGEDEGDMVLFSQILRSAGEHPPGIAEDDDEIDGAVLFGDADETREL